MKDIALVTHDFSRSGGAASMTTFLYDVLRESEEYNPEVISLATTSHDEASVRVIEPQTWRTGPRIISRRARGIEHRHVGTWCCEIEPFRYRPRAVLNDVLAGFDIIQFVTGNPPWAYVARDVDRPSFLWTATTLWEDRETRLNVDRGPRGLWRQIMTRWAEVYESRALQEVNGVFALSEYTQRTLKQRFGRDSTFAPQGIDTEQFHPIRDPEQDYILTVSRINDPRKRVPLLLEAYAAAKDEYDKLPNLYVVGDEPGKPIRAKARTLGITNSVRFLGRQSQAQLVQLYQNALCFVLSSDEEGLGIVILEAMACGRPAISTRSGGPETLIVDGESGFLTPVGQADPLRKKILRLAQNPSLRHQMGRRARQRVEKKFSNEVAQQPFLETYGRY